MLATQQIQQMPMVQAQPPIPMPSKLPSRAKRELLIARLGIDEVRRRERESRAKSRKARAEELEKDPELKARVKALAATRKKRDKLIQLLGIDEVRRRERELRAKNREQKALREGIQIKKRKNKTVPTDGGVAVEHYNYMSSSDEHTPQQQMQQQQPLPAAVNV